CTSLCLGCAGEKQIPSSPRRKIRIETPVRGGGELVMTTFGFRTSRTEQERFFDFTSRPEIRNDSRWKKRRDVSLRMTSPRINPLNLSVGGGRARYRHSNGRSRGAHKTIADQRDQNCASQNQRDG